jgi:hypothetical protein
MTSRKTADLKFGNLGNVTVSCMECHLVLYISLVAEVAGDKLPILLLSVFGSMTGRGGGAVGEGGEEDVKLIEELLLASLFVTSEVKKRFWR